VILRIKLVLKLKGLGLWGAGRESFEADTITYKIRLKDGREIPAIPGSYVKGLLRGWSYKLAPLLSRAEIISSRINAECFAGATCGRCIICQIFGASGGGLPPLSVTNFYPVTADKLAQAAKLRPEELTSRPDLIDQPRLSYSPHVRIEDSSGNAAKGGLYMLETVPPRTLFYGEVALQKHLLNGVKPGDAYLLILLAISQLRFSYAGRRSRVEVRILPESDLKDALSDKRCAEVLGRLMMK